MSSIPEQIIKQAICRQLEDAHEIYEMQSNQKANNRGRTKQWALQISIKQ